jgi:uncharacterized protein YqgC (DUF456 family)
MDAFLYIVGLVLLFLFCAVAAFSLILGLPGTIALVVIALVYAWATGFAGVTGTVIAWLVGLAVVAEGFEFASTVWATGSETPSRRVTISALVGAVVGGLVGTPFLFGVGSLFGALGGAFVGAAVASSAEGRSAAGAMSAGFAALRGRLLGFIVKASIAVVMILVILAAAI